MLIETDLLLSLISPEDKHHSVALKLVDRLSGKAKISPYSFMELDLLIKSGEVIVESVPEFYEALSGLLKYRMVETYPLKLEYHREAFILRSKYRTLTYFDSLHAAVAIIEDLTLISYDRVYADLAEVKYMYPEDYQG